MSVCDHDLREEVLRKFSTDRLQGELERRDALTAQQASSDPVRIFLDQVAEEVARARTKFPGDRLTGLALAEEFGELIKALLDEPGKAVWKEAVQTACMAARVAVDGDGSVDTWRANRGLDNHRHQKNGDMT